MKSVVVVVTALMVFSSSLYAANVLENALEKLAAYEKLSLSHMRERSDEITAVRSLIITILKRSRNDIPLDTVRKALISLKAFNELYKKKMSEARATVPTLSKHETLPAEQNSGAFHSSSPHATGNVLCSASVAPNQNTQLCDTNLPDTNLAGLGNQHIPVATKPTGSAQYLRENRFVTIPPRTMHVVHSKNTQVKIQERPQGLLLRRHGRMLRMNPK